MRLSWLVHRKMPPELYSNRFRHDGSDHGLRRSAVDNLYGHRHPEMAPSIQRLLAWIFVGAGTIALAFGGWLSTGSVTRVQGAVRAIEPIQHVEGGVDLTLDSLPRKILFEQVSTESRLPQIQTGDEVTVWEEDDGQTEVWGLALESQRGNWQDSAWQDHVPIFSPQTWKLRDALRWTGISGGAVMLVIGGAILRFGLGLDPARGSRRREFAPGVFPLIVIGIAGLALLFGACVFLIVSLNRLH